MITRKQLRRIIREQVETITVDGEIWTRDDLLDAISDYSKELTGVRDRAIVDRLATAPIQDVAAYYESMFSSPEAIDMHAQFQGVDDQSIGLEDDVHPMEMRPSRGGMGRRLESRSMTRIRERLRNRSLVREFWGKKKKKKSKAPKATKLQIIQAALKMGDTESAPGKMAHSDRPKAWNAVRDKLVKALEKKGEKVDTSFGGKALSGGLGHAQLADLVTSAVMFDIFTSGRETDTYLGKVAETIKDLETGGKFNAVRQYGIYRLEGMTELLKKREVKAISSTPGMIYIHLLAALRKKDDPSKLLSNKRSVFKTEISKMNEDDLIEKIRKLIGDPAKKKMVRKYNPKALSRALELLAIKRSQR